MGPPAGPTAGLTAGVTAGPHVMKVPDGDALERKGMCVYVGSASVYGGVCGGGVSMKGESRKEFGLDVLGREGWD